MSDMAVTPDRSASLRDLRRDPDNGMVAGVCEGLGKRLDIDPLLLRIVFGATTLASGLGLVAYVLAWMLVPAEDKAPAAAVSPEVLRTRRNRRAALEVGLGTGCLVIALLLTFREAGLPFSDALTWPFVLVAAGGALIWRQSVGRPGARRVELRDAGAPAGARAAALASAPVAPLLLDEADADSRPAVISRIGIGVTLVIAAAIVFLQITGALAAASDVALAAIVVVIALVVIFAPFFFRLATSLSLERAERIRSQERAEVAAHLHDSVLQTLALVQKRAGRGARAAPGARTAHVAERGAGPRGGRALAGRRAADRGAGGRGGARRGDRCRRGRRRAAGPRRRGARRGRARGDAQRSEVRR